MVTLLRSWIVVAASRCRGAPLLCCLAGTATQRRGYNRFNASMLQLFDLGLPIRAAVLVLGEASVSE
jgi:hypothetical protein